MDKFLLFAVGILIGAVSMGALFLWLRSKEAKQVPASVQEALDAIKPEVEALPPEELWSLYEQLLVRRRKPHA